MTTTNDMSCQELVELVTEYFEDTLPAKERARFEEHLGVCSGCRTYLDQMRQAIQMVGALSEESISDDARDQLLRAFRSWKAAGRTAGG